MKTAPKDTRHRCQFCKAVTWQKDYVAFMKSHDRPEGGVCRRAQKVYDSQVSSPNAERVKEALTK